MTDRLYHGVRTKDRTAVTVILAPGERRPLEDEHGLIFDWGRPTDGALALTRALLRDTLGDQATPEIENRFFQEVVLTLPFIDPWVLWCEEVREFAGTVTASG